MPVKIRLARHGRKQHAYYHIVVADSRAPRDGRFIERIGSYNPNTNPATIDLDFDKALVWLSNGAQPTDTCRAILSYKGVLMKKHLLEGVRKGAFDEAVAEQRFGAWLNEKEKTIQAKKDKLAAGFEQEMKKRLKAEAKINEIRLAEISKKNAAIAAKAAVESQAAEEPANESDSAEPKAEV
jgi:small subunit ribosomal protein S16